MSDRPPIEQNHFLHMLDEFRREYEDKSGEKCSIPVQGMATLHMPTWEYTNWLERKLYGITNIVPTVVGKLTTNATYTSDGNQVYVMVNQGEK